MGQLERAGEMGGAVGRKVGVQSLEAQRGQTPRSRVKLQKAGERKRGCPGQPCLGRVRGPGPESFPC